MKKLLGIAVLPLFAGCGFAYGAGVGYEEVYVEDAYYGGGAYYEADYVYRGSYRRLPVPRAYVPAPGRCRVWLPGVPPARQPRSGSCRIMERRVPPGGWLLVRPYRYPGVVELVAYDRRRPGIKTRYLYDVRDGRRVNRYF